MAAPSAVAICRAVACTTWTDSIANKVQRSNLDGTDLVDLVRDIPGAGIALDLEGRRSC